MAAKTNHDKRLLSSPVALSTNYLRDLLNTQKKQKKTNYKIKEMII